MYNYKLRDKVEQEMLRLGNDATEDQLYMFDKMEDEYDDDLFYEIVENLARDLKIK